MRTIFKPLLKRGIKPDFAVILDYHPISAKYFEDAPGDEDVVLVADPKAAFEAVDAHRGPKAVIHNDALHRIIGEPAFQQGDSAGRHDGRALRVLLRRSTSAPTPSSSRARTSRTPTA